MRTNRNRSWLEFVAGLSVTLALVACGGGGGSGGAAGSASSTTQGAVASASNENVGTGPPTVNGAATLSWTAPLENSDGTPLVDLAGYRIYYGRQSGNYSDTIDISNPGITIYVVQGLAPGTYYFTMTAVNGADVESEFSNEVVVKFVS